MPRPDTTVETKKAQVSLLATPAQNEEDKPADIVDKPFAREDVATQQKSQPTEEIKIPIPTRYPLQATIPGRLTSMPLQQAEREQSRHEAQPLKIPTIARCTFEQTYYYWGLDIDLASKGSVIVELLEAARWPARHDSYDDSYWVERIINLVAGSTNCVKNGSIVWVNNLTGIYLNNKWFKAAVPLPGVVDGSRITLTDVVFGVDSADYVFFTYKGSFFKKKRHEFIRGPEAIQLKEDYRPEMRARLEAAVRREAAQR